MIFTDEVITVCRLQLHVLKVFIPRAIRRSVECKCLKRAPGISQWYLNGTALNEDSKKTARSASVESMERLSREKSIRQMGLPVIKLPPLTPVKIVQLSSSLQARRDELKRKF